MCTYANGVLIAYTGTPIPEPETIMDLSEPSNTPISQSSEGRQPFEFQDHQALLRYGTRNKCNSHNFGRMPPYKDHRQARPEIW